MNQNRESKRDTSLTLLPEHYPTQITTGPPVIQPGPFAALFAAFFKSARYQVVRVFDTLSVGAGGRGG